MEYLEDLCCLKIQHLIDPEADEKMWFSSSYLYWHKTTLDRAEGKSKMFGNRQCFT